MKHLFVINPHSFKVSDIRDVLREIEACFIGEDEGAYKIHISRCSRDAIAVVYNYIASFPKTETVRVYAVGGTGILFECLNGMAHFPNAELTSVPYGNANEFVNIFGENAFEKFRIIRNFMNAPSHPMDIIDCGSNYSIVGVSIGLIGQTVINANNFFPKLPVKWLRKNIGHAYSFCAVRALFDNAVMRQQYSLIIDGEEISGNYCNIQVQNIACTGGTMCQSPYSKPDEGNMHVLLAATHKKMDIIKSIGEYNQGLFEKYSFYHHKICETIEIKSDTMLCVAVDGEGFYAHELKLKVIPKGINVFAPEGFSFADYSGKAYNRKGLHTDEK